MMDLASKVADPAILFNVVVVMVELSFIYRGVLPMGNGKAPGAVLIQLFKVVELKMADSR